MVYMSFRLKIKVVKAGGEKGKWVQSNKGEIIFTYDEAEKKMGLTRPRFQRCLDALVELGFIDITHHGNGLRGDCSKYDISERWREYGKPEFVEMRRPKGSKGFGFKSKNKGNKTELSYTDVTSPSNADVTYHGPHNDVQETPALLRVNGNIIQHHFENNGQLSK
jgi:hypothetical protein